MPPHGRRDTRCHPNRLSPWHWRNKCLLVNIDFKWQPRISNRHGCLVQLNLCSRRLKVAGVGLGKDYRYEIEDVFGSALIFDQRVIHLAFFKNLEVQDE